MNQMTLKENNVFYSHIKFLVETTKTATTIDKINESINHIKGLMLEKEVEVTNERINNLNNTLVFRCSCSFAA